jgi:hypothetical protein
MADQDLLRTIQHVRGRWKLALLLRGASICVVTALVLIALSALGFAEFGFTPQTITALRWIVGLTALAVFVVVVVLPAMRTVSDERVALYIEEREPALQSVLISAIETDAGSSSLARALIARAAAQCRQIDFGVGIERKRLKRNGYAFAGVVVVAAAILGAGPSPLRDSARALFTPTPAAEAAGIMSIAAFPGNDTIARGADIAVTAEMHGFKPDEAFVVVRDKSGEWRRWSMSAAQQASKFEAVLFDIVESTDYYVEAKAVRSPAYRIEVVDAPFVKTVTLEYQFPAYTGLPGKRVDDGGDIVAPKGTLVRVIAATSTSVGEGRLQLEDARAIRMQPTGASELAASMRVLRDGLYHIELPGLNGSFNSASAQYAITVIQDEPPTVKVDKPGRDVKVTAVDEVFVSATAEDDYGIAKLEMVYSVNGGPQQTIAFPAPRPAEKNVTGGHTFFLEDLSLKPGDFVSYFVRASDNNAIDGAKTASTDIYFVQIRPYSREYREAQQQGMPGGGGGENEGALSERQRQIIAATFNVSRDRATYTDKGYREALTTVELSQKRLREQVGTLLQRMQQRGVVDMDSMFAQIAELLPQAIREMAAAEGQLQQQKPDDALPPEQKSLQALLRAEALYREVQVQMQQQPGNADGGQPPAEDLASLFDLERDQLRNQYEQVQRSQGEQAQRQIDETMERLRELAQRQQQEAERQQQAARGQQQQQGGAGGTGGQQRRLADEAEEQARQLERLAREQNNQQVADAARRLREAAEAMRRASAQQDGRGLADAQSARERLNEARRRLQETQRSSLQQRINEARQRAEELREQQRGIAQESENVSGSQNADQIRRLGEQKNQLGTGIAQLENQLDRMSAEARGANREAARQLQEAADGIRSSRLRERIRATQQNPQFRSREFNRAQEEQISRDLDRVSQQLAQASAAAGQESREGQQRNAMERARALAQGAQSMQDRARSAQENAQGNQQGNQQSRSQQGNQQGNQQEGQQQGNQQGNQEGNQPGNQSQQGSANRARNAQETQRGSATAQGASRSGGNDAEVQRQLRAEARERASELQDLQRDLRQLGIGTENLNEAMSALRALQNAGAYNDPEELERLLAKVTRGLQDFEFGLRQALEQSDKQKLFEASPGQVPVQFRKAVEEYYRRLSRER